MARVTENRTDPDLCEILVRQSNETVHWLKDQGLRFLPQFGRQAFKVDGRYKFWGGATLAVSGGGRGMVDSLFKAAEKKGIDVVYDAWVRDLISSDDGRARRRGADRRQDDEDISPDRWCLPAAASRPMPSGATRYLGPGLGPRKGARLQIQHR